MARIGGHAVPTVALRNRGRQPTRLAGGAGQNVIVLKELRTLQILHEWVHQLEHVQRRVGREIWLEPQYPDCGARKKETKKQRREEKKKGRKNSAKGTDAKRRVRRREMLRDVRVAARHALLRRYSRRWLW